MICYTKLWRLMQRRGLGKRDIIHLAGISESTYQKLMKDEAVRLDVLERICVALGVDIGDVCSFRVFGARRR